MTEAMILNNSIKKAIIHEYIRKWLSFYLSQAILLLVKCSMTVTLQSILVVFFLQIILIILLMEKERSILTMVNYGMNLDLAL